MAAKKLGSVTTVANTTHTVYTVPSGLSAVFNIVICNTGSLQGDVTLTLGGDIIEYEMSIGSSGVLERTGLIAEAGETLEVLSTTDDMVVRAHGMEE
jgi:hypothetical protein